MDLPTKLPPRFVPTLTEVVHVSTAVTVTASQQLDKQRFGSVAESDGLTPKTAFSQASETAPLPASAQHPGVATQGAGNFTASARRAVQGSIPSGPATGREPVASTPVRARPLSDELEEYMVHRVMHRVDAVLDQRLKDAIAAVVQEQTRSVLPRLREEIESVVRHAVYEAVAEELASGPQRSGER